MCCGGAKACSFVVLSVGLGAKAFCTRPKHTPECVSVTGLRAVPSSRGRMCRQKQVKAIPGRDVGLRIRAALCCPCLCSQKITELDVAGVIPFRAEQALAGLRNPDTRAGKKHLPGNASKLPRFEASRLRTSDLAPLFTTALSDCNPSWLSTSALKLHDSRTTIVLAGWRSLCRAKR